MLRQDVGKVLGHPISNVASFAQIIEDHSRDAGNTQRIMRDLIAVCLTKLEEMEPDQIFELKASDLTNILQSPIALEDEVEETVAKYEPKSKTKPDPSI